RKSKADQPPLPTPPAVPFAPESFPAPGPPAESRDEDPVPYADFQTDVPFATPVSEVGLPSVAAELTGPEVALQPDGTAVPTGGMVELAVSGGWLAARSAAPDGTGRETYLRLGRLEAVALRDRPGAGLVLSAHAGSEAVAVLCE